MKQHRLAAIFAGTFLLVPASSYGQDPHGSGAAPAGLTLAQWTQRVQAELNRNIRYPRPILGRAPATGTVRVKFNCSDTGRPDRVELDRSSGDRDLDLAAVRAVKRIATLHPLPDGMRPDQRYRAVLLFHNGSQRDHDLRLKVIDDEAAKANAWFGRRTAAIASR